MKAFELAAGGGIDALRLLDRPTGALGPHEVRVKMAAAALNFRDLMFAEGSYGVPVGQVVVPLSDGAGEVIETGAAVTRVKSGDRVIFGFWPQWIDGDIGTAKVAGSFGAQFDGTLAEQVVADEQSLTIAPAGMSAAEAASVACAGVTAWNALFVRGGLKPGATVLLLGTGGVSIWALQLAHAAGLRPIVISSSDEKLQRARQLGAVGTVNYLTTPEWQHEVKRLTGGAGVDLVLEIGGNGTLSRSIEATRLGGTVIVVGARAGGAPSGVEPGALIGGTKTLAGIMVGSRAMQEDLVRFIDAVGIRPVIDRTFPFGEAVSAYRYMQQGPFGKVVIDIGGYSEGV
jgi:NADPH:quinone reductase-like Zn-dependent oxidoreductase